jgi:hypothetical protein
MGWNSYIIHFSVDDPKTFLAENKEKAARKFCSLLDDEHFPECSSYECVEGSPGDGFSDKNIKSLIKFTKIFPNYTFKVWLSCFNFFEMHVFEIKGDEILSKNVFVGGMLEITNGLKIYYDFENPSIENNISMDIFHCALSEFDK